MIHLQVPVPNWLEAVKLLPDYSLVKAVDQGQVFREVKAINPTIRTCLCHHYDRGQIFGGSYEENKARARSFFNSFVDSTFLHTIAPHCDFVEEWNEYLANSQNETELSQRVMWAGATADVWRNEYRSKPELSHIRLVLCNTAVGNWIDKRFFITARAFDAVMGYHPYSHWFRGARSAHDWPDLSGLFDPMELSHGIKVDWLFTEAGPFESAITGWRHYDCLNHHVDTYISAVRDWLRDVKSTAANKDGRILGFALFTTGRAGTTWQHFYTEQPELNRLAAMVAEEWTMTQPPSPPPIPSPRPCRGRPREQYRRTYNVIPENATDEQALAIFKEAWSRSRETVGGSYDDAGIGDLDQRTARLYGISSNKRNLFSSWFAREYPGVALLFSDIPAINANNQPSPAKDHPLSLIYPVLNSYHSINPGGRFNDPRSYANGLHEGVDLYAQEGDIVVAAAAGTVVWADDEKRDRYDEPSLYGNHVLLDHGRDLYTWYAHLDVFFIVPDDFVEQGAFLGEAGSTGNSTGIHLHFAIQHIGHGLSGYVIADVLDPTPFLFDSEESLHPRTLLSGGTS